MVRLKAEFGTLGATSKGAQSHFLMAASRFASSGPKGGAVSFTTRAFSASRARCSHEGSTRGAEKDPPAVVTLICTVAPAGSNSAPCKAAISKKRSSKTPIDQRSRRACCNKILFSACARAAFGPFTRHLKGTPRKETRSNGVGETVSPEPPEDAAAAGGTWAEASSEGEA